MVTRRHAAACIVVALFCFSAAPGAEQGREKPSPPKDAPEAPADPKKPRKPKKKQPQPEQQIGAIKYRCPAGWESVEKDAIVLLTPKGVSPGECSVVLVSGEVLRGDFHQWFKQKWAGFQKKQEISQGGQLNAQVGAGGVDVMYQSALLEDQTNTERKSGLLLYAAHVGDGVEWVVFRTAGPNATDLFNKHNKAVSRMLTGLKFERTEVVPKEPAKP